MLYHNDGSTFFRISSFAAGAKSRSDARRRICLRVASDTGPGLVDKGKRLARLATCAWRKGELSARTLRKLTINASLFTICAGTVSGQRLELLVERLCLLAVLHVEISTRRRT